MRDRSTYRAALRNEIKAKRQLPIWREIAAARANRKAFPKRMKERPGSFRASPATRCREGRNFGAGLNGELAVIRRLRQMDRGQLQVSA